MAEQHSPRKWIMWFFIVLLALGFLAGIVWFLPIDYYADDYITLLDHPEPGFFRYFAESYPFSVGYYRPFALIFYHFVQANWGENSWPIHLTHLLLLLLLVGLVYYGGRRLGLSLRAALIAGLVVLGSQVALFATISNDTISQLISVFCGYGGLLLLYLSRKEETPRRPLYYSLSLLLLFVSLLAKETAPGFVAAWGIVLFTTSPKEKGRLRKALLAFIPVILVALGYLVLREIMVGTPPKLDEQLILGPHLLINTGLLIVGVATPVSTTFMASVMGDGNVPLLLLGLVLMSLTGLVTALGLFRRNNTGLKITLGLILLTSTFPSILTDTVSELYAFNLLPAWALLAGLAVDTLLTAWQKKRYRFALYASLGLIAITMTVSLFHKAGLMRDNADRAARLREQLSPLIAELPSQSHLYLVNPPGNQTEYSIFLMSGFNVIDSVIDYFPLIPRRYDVTYSIVEWEELDTLEYQPNTILLYLDEDDVSISTKPTDLYL